MYFSDPYFSPNSVYNLAGTVSPLTSNDTEKKLIVASHLCIFISSEGEFYFC
jgi:hypothetical protein